MKFFFLLLFFFNAGMKSISLNVLTSMALANTRYDQNEIRLQKDSLEPNALDVKTISKQFPTRRSYKVDNIPDTEFQNKGQIFTIDQINQILSNVRELPLELLDENEIKKCLITEVNEISPTNNDLPNKKISSDGNNVNQTKLTSGTENNSSFLKPLDTVDKMGGSNSNSNLNKNLFNLDPDLPPILMYTNVTTNTLSKFNKPLPLMLPHKSKAEN